MLWSFKNVNAQSWCAELELGVSCICASEILNKTFLNIFQLIISAASSSLFISEQNQIRRICSPKMNFGFL